MGKFFVFSLVLFLSPSFIFAQHIKIDKKALYFLTSQEKVNIVFIQDSLLMIDNLYEMEFIQKMRKKIGNKTTPQEATSWISKYKESKDESWPESFVTQLNDKLDENKVAPNFLRNYNEAEYTLKVTPTWMYFGYDAGIIDRPAKVTLQLSFYESNNPNTIIFSTEISRAMAKYNKRDGDGEGAGPSLNRM